MTLTLDDVRNTKFRMARRSGYEVVDVDQFVDQVEEAFAQLTEENQVLKQQVEALKSGGAVHGDREDESDRRGPGQQPSGRGHEQKAGPAAPDTGVASDGADRVIVTTSAEASPAVVRLVQLATEQAEQLVAEASEEAGQTVESSKRTAQQLTTDARTDAERIESEARTNAEKMRTDAQNRATDLDREIDDRRRQMLSHLEQERDHLKSAVEELREFEAAFRTNLTDHLKSQVDALEKATFEPGTTPGLLAEPSANSTAGRHGRSEEEPAAADRQADQRKNQNNEQPGDQGGDEQRGTASNTPRLDALLRDQN